MYTHIEGHIHGSTDTLTFHDAISVFIVALHGYAAATVGDHRADLFHRHNILQRAISIRMIYSMIYGVRYIYCMFFLHSAKLSLQAKLN